MSMHDVQLTRRDPVHIARWHIGAHLCVIDRFFQAYDASLKIVGVARPRRMLRLIDLSLFYWKKVDQGEAERLFQIQLERIRF